MYFYHLFPFILKFRSTFQYREKNRAHAVPMMSCTLRLCPCVCGVMCVVEYEKNLKSANICGLLRFVKITK